MPLRRSAYGTPCAHPPTGDVAPLPRREVFKSNLDQIERLKSDLKAERTRAARMAGALDAVRYAVEHNAFCTIFMTEPGLTGGSMTVCEFINKTLKKEKK